MPDENKGSSVPPSRTSAVTLVTLLRWPAVVVLVATVAAFLARESCRSVERSASAPAEVVEGLGDAVSSIAERFRTEKITTTFRSSLPRLLEEGGPRLEVAALESVETLTRVDERRVLFDRLSLGTTTSEIRVPVTFRYHLSFDEPWALEVTGQDCRVRAPPLRPTLPPAIHTDGLERRSERGWLRFDGEVQMAELERSLTKVLSERAASAETVALVRDRARAQVGRFIRSWLVLEDHWRPDRFRSITVTFEDEPEAEERPPLPTIMLELRRGELSRGPAR